MHLRRRCYQRRFAIVMGQKSQLWPDLPALDTFELNRRIYEIDEDAYRRTLDEPTGLLDVRALLQVQVRRLSLGERMKMELMRRCCTARTFYTRTSRRSAWTSCPSAASAIFSNITTNRRAPRFC